MWLVLLHSCVKHKRVFISQRGVEYMWSGVVLWVTPWTIALRVSWGDPDTTHMVYIPIGQIDSIRDFSPSASVEAVKDAYRGEPPEGTLV